MLSDAQTRRQLGIALKNCRTEVLESRELPQPWLPRVFVVRRLVLVVCRPVALVLCTRHADDATAASGASQTHDVVTRF
jgi:hypothetical protein